MITCTATDAHSAAGTATTTVLVTDEVPVITFTITSTSLNPSGTTLITCSAADSASSDINSIAATITGTAKGTLSGTCTQSNTTGIGSATLGTTGCTYTAPALASATDTIQCSATDTHDLTKTATTQTITTTNIPPTVTTPTAQNVDLEFTLSNSDGNLISNSYYQLDCGIFPATSGVAPTYEIPGTCTGSVGSTICQAYPT